MSVLIKGMEMPKNCNECPLHFYEGQAICSCRLLHTIDDEILKPWKNKRKDCPLVSIKPHGDLIDRDEQIERAWRLNLSTRELIETMLKTASTIIPAEEGE